ncbi:MAG: spermidine/putrescine ABC transporter substrate-binding protein [Gammaproteobacteria bacterium]|nr:spermidine/putrescine ABC transporter substrate-binding protein [Gammaproteobacteria bacterium]
MTDHRPLRLHCWEGYERAGFLAPFRDRYGADVSVQALVTDYEAARNCAAAESERPDILNINNAWIRGYLDPLGAIRPLQDGQFSGMDGDIHPDFARLAAWTRSADGDRRLGIAQRFGAFNLVVNTRRISLGTAEAEGFSLARDPSMKRRYGILLYRDFNLFHLAIAAGLNPFRPFEEEAFAKFEAMAAHWFESAGLLSEDHFVLNRKLVDGEIDFYLSGGTYTASPARLAGHGQIRAVTPRSGPVDGLGGIVFTEVTSVLVNPDPHPLADRFLDWLLSEDAAHRAATAPRTLNPVLQMGNPAVMERFTSAELDAIQWDSLAEDVARCTEYDLMPDHDRLAGVLDSEIKRHQHLIVEDLP